MSDGTHFPVVRGFGLLQSCSSEELRGRVLSRAHAQQADRLAIEELQIPGVVLMENAARAASAIAMEMLSEAGPGDQHRVVVLCGSGNNGGDGYAAARHLYERGVAVDLVALGEPRGGSEAAINASICQNMGLKIAAWDQRTPPQEPDLVIDAMFGIGLDRPIAGAASDVVAWTNQANCPVLAMDVPSGLDCDTGLPLGPTVKATTTVTFVALKPGLIKASAHPFTGHLVVADIGVSSSLLQMVEADS